ncbi:MAG: hypothetical protein J6S85_12315 [Methanobrevibacter sp.]|nr:hypothetical protein [Methanobrevibacter sp.]
MSTQDSIIHYSKEDFSNIVSSFEDLQHEAKINVPQAPASTALEAFGTASTGGTTAPQANNVPAFAHQKPMMANILAQVQSLVTDSEIVSTEGFTEGNRPSVSQLLAGGRSLVYSQEKVANNQLHVANKIAETLQNCGLEAYRIPQLTRNLFIQLLRGSTAINDPAEREDFVKSCESMDIVPRDFGTGNRDNLLNPRLYFDPKTYGDLLSDNKSLARAFEAFGQNINEIPIDNRLTLTLTIARAKTSYMERAFATVSQPTNHVVIRVPWAEVYTLNNSNNPNPQVRSQAPMLLNTLFLNPTSVNTQPQLVTPLLANDNGTPKALAASVYSDQVTDTTYINTGVTTNLFTLTNNQARMGYQDVNFSDIIADGGYVDTVLVKVTSTPSSGSPTSEIFEVPVSTDSSTTFTRGTNSDNSMVQTVQFTFFTIFSASTQVLSAGNQVATTIGSVFTQSKARIRLTLSAQMDTNIGTYTCTGVAEATQVPAMTTTNSTQGIPAEEATAYGQLTFEVVAFKNHLMFDEENLRKTNLAVRSRNAQVTFVIPQGRTLIVDYALQQKDDPDTLQMISTTITLGNDARNFIVSTNKQDNVYSQLNNLEQNPELTGETIPQKLSIVAPVILPAIQNITIDMSEATISNMRESEKPTDMMTHFQNAIMPVLQEIVGKSLYSTVLEPGEQIVFKAIANITVIHRIFGIRQYHEILTYPGTHLTGADLSFGLPNNLRVDAIGTYMTTINGKEICGPNQSLMYFFPVRERDPAHWSSFGTIQNSGTYNATFAHQHNGAVQRRLIHNSREIMFPTNPMGLIATITGLNTYLGSVSPLVFNVNTPKYNTVT